MTRSYTCCVSYVEPWPSPCCSKMSRGLSTVPAKTYGTCALSATTALHTAGGARFFFCSLPHSASSVPLNMFR